MAKHVNDERPRCGTPCLNHAHACDRSPRHTGFHRDVQQKGDHTCEWDTPGPKDFPAVMTALGSARAEMKRLRDERMIDLEALRVAAADLKRARAVAANAGEALGEQIDRAVAAEAERDQARAELADASRFLDQSCDDVAGWRDSYERLSRQLLRRHFAWQSARRGRALARKRLRDVGLIRLAISDPGAFVKRKRFNDGDYETVPAWGARAVVLALQEGRGSR